MDVGFLSALVGGALALLSPCAALLLPAFFASAAGAGTRLLVHGTVFYLGMLLVLVPLGLGAGALGALFTAHRQEIVFVAAVLLVVLGIAQFFGLGFDPARLVPGGRTARDRAAGATGMTKTFLLGATSGIAGVCAGPILGAVLTLAAARGDVLSAGLMLAVYGAGMVIPLFAIAALWKTLGTRGRGVLRGTAVRAFGRELHTTSMVTGGLMIIVGVVFWMTNGLVSMPSLVPTDVLARLQSMSALTNTAMEITVVVLAAALAVLLWIRHERRRSSTGEQTTSNAWEDQ